MRVPAELKRTIHPMMVEHVNLRVFSPIVLILVMVYGFACSNIPNGWTRYVPPVLGPIFIGTLFLLHPWNPYRSLYARRMGIQSEAAVADDCAAQRLLQMLRSTRARILSLQYGFMTALLFELAMCVIIPFRPAPRHWTVSAYEILVFTIPWSAFAIGVHNTLLFRWACQSWKMPANEIDSSA